LKFEDLTGNLFLEFFGELEENQLARARFIWDAEGWNCSTKDGELWPVNGELQHLKASDDDDTIWYYTASPEFLGIFSVLRIQQTKRILKTVS
jgi:hypothetical protein